MRLILAGTPCFATEVFAPIIESKQFDILGLICQPDKPFGRKAELKAPHTKQYLHDHNLNHLQIFQPEKIDETFIESITQLKPDIILVVAYGKILPKAFLQIAPCINIHASILPSLRGASPLQQMILNQPHYFGVSAMRIDEGLDSGEILGFSYVPNTKQDLPTLSNQLAYAGAKLALRVLNNLEHIAPLPQLQAYATYCTKIKKSDGKVSFECNAQDIYHASLAYVPWPGIFIQSPKGYILKLFDLTLIESTQSHQAGEILDIDTQSIIIGCQKGCLKIGFIQQEGKSKLEASTYVRGKRLGKGDKLC